MEKKTLKLSEKIKSRWLYGFYIYAITVLILCNIEFIANITSPVIFSFDFFLSIAFENLFILFMLWLPYYFGYKKEGSAILSLVIVFGSIKFFAQLIEVFIYIKSNLVLYGLRNWTINFINLISIIVLAIIANYLINSGYLFALNTTPNCLPSNDKENV